MKQKKFFSEIEQQIPLPDKSRVDTVIFLGQKYMDAHTPKKTSVPYLFTKQVKYLSPSMWLMSFVSVIAISALAIMYSDTAENIYGILFKIAPLVSVVAVPELMKDVLCNMSELERSCKNSGSVLLLLRLIAVGIINITVIAFTSGLLAYLYNLKYFELLLYAFVPYNCANIISLLLIRTMKINSRLGALSVSFTSALALMMIPFQIHAAELISTWTLVACFLLSITVLTIQVVQVFKKLPKGEYIYGTQN